jgi:crotonobetainyl-CoA:carnitine CoA-transferase CaiB-like acyl-CoA transferase
MEQARPNRPLSDVTVIDFGQIFQGPYASLLLAKAGAFVIKVEPLHGEPGRRRAEPGKSATLPFAMLNQNKHAITLNLKHERGRELLFQMVERADVLLENFSPGTMDGLGVGWSRVREINPRLIYATGTGFGISGPDRDNLAMDMTIQAASGIMSVTGFPDGPPVKAGPTLVDFMGGIHLYAGIVTALYDRDRSGVGRLVEVAMQETVYPTLAASYDYFYRTGEIPPRTGNRQSGLNSAPYNVFPTADGHVAIHVVTEAHFQNLLKAMEREDLMDDPRFATNAARVAHMDETDAVVEAWTRTLPKTDVFAHQGLPHPMRAGAHGARGYERPAHARTRHARTDRSPRTRRDRGSDHPLAPARHRQGGGRPEPDNRPTQRRDLRRLARAFAC